jgi:FAD/FMN-containing dehydrogenase
MDQQTELSIVTIRGETTTIDAAIFQAFVNCFQGEIIRPGDAAYDDARYLWTGMIDRYPALIARCHDAMDVIATINFARTHHLFVTVRGGRHNAEGSASCDGGLLIDLSLMKRVEVDAEARIVRAEAGASWEDVDRATWVYGLAVPGEVVSETGIAGPTLGGEMAWRRRMHPLATDSLRAVDVVTANGQFVRASAHEHPDLFGALRGSSGHLGVVTTFEYQLHPLGSMAGGVQKHMTGKPR